MRKSRCNYVPVNTLDFSVDTLDCSVDTLDCSAIELFNGCSDTVVEESVSRKKPGFNKENENTRKEDKLKCALLNARSMMNKRDELESFKYDVKPDIVMITESWGRSEVEDVELKIPGYNLFRNDRKHSTGGGCLIYSQRLSNCTVIT